jgi:hypothetical protein
MKGATMSRKQRQNHDERVVQRPREAKEPKPRNTSFVAAPCSLCQSLRDSSEESKGKSYSRVYATVGKVRYCKCGYCGNTWKQVEDTNA